MKVAVFGAGAVGCYYGAMLARAGHAVTLIGRHAHVAAIGHGGLLLETAGGRERVGLAATEDARGAQGAGLVLCCVKSTDTEQAGALLAPHLAPQAALLSLQNGVDNAPRLAQAAHHAALAAVVYVGVEMAGPGHVRHHGRGELVLAASPASADLARLFAAAGVPTEVSDNVVGALWSKLILNSAYNAISALSRQPYGQLIRGPGVEAVMRRVMDECLAVAAADGVAVPGDPWEDVLRIARTMPAQFSSTAQDVARGRRSEIDHLNGYVVRRAAAHGLAVPVNETLWALVRLLEAGRA